MHERDLAVFQRVRIVCGGPHGYAVPPVVQEDVRQFIVSAPFA
jgi:hypothetical protein